MNQSGTDIGVACFAQKCAVLNQVHFTDPTTSEDDIVYESPTSYLPLPQGSCCVFLCHPESPGIWIISSSFGHWLPITIVLLCLYSIKVSGSQLDFP